MNIIYIQLSATKGKDMCSSLPRGTLLSCHNVLTCVDFLFPEDKRTSKLVSHFVLDETCQHLRAYRSLPSMWKITLVLNFLHLVNSTIFFSVISRNILIRSVSLSHWKLRNQYLPRSNLLSIFWCVSTWNRMSSSFCHTFRKVFSYWLWCRNCRAK